MYSIPLFIFVFIIGLLVGSFLNVCIYRIPLERTVVKGRSYCPACGKLIPWYCNIPVVSYLVLKGRCKDCREPISPLYPVVELLNALLTLSAFCIYGFTVTALLLSGLFSLLIVVSLIDLFHMIIPDGLVVCVAVLGVLHAAYRIFVFHDPWHTFFIGIFAASVPLFLLGLIYPDGIGGGDLKLMAAAGLFAGWKLALIGLLLGDIIALFYVIFLFFQKKAGRGTAIPFGPFLSMGMIGALLMGDQLITWYLSAFAFL